MYYIIQKQFKIFAAHRAVNINHNFLVAANPLQDKITVDDLPHINPMEIGKARKIIVNLINSIPTYYYKYLGKDKMVPLKKSVLHPEYPQSK